MAVTETRGLDVVGDVHGCLTELHELIEVLGYEVSPRRRLAHPEGRQLVFVGDLVDRGPAVVEVLELVIQAVIEGNALCILGNHDANLIRSLRSYKPSYSNLDVATSLAQLSRQPLAIHDRVEAFLATLPIRLFLDEERLLVVHAGDRPELPEPERSHYNVYGRDTDKTDDYGYPLRDDWVRDNGHNRLIVYGHTPITEPYWRGKTLNIDTGCVFGGKLTALRYPELTLVSVEAHDAYAPSRRFNRRQKPLQ